MTSLRAALSVSSNNEAFSSSSLSRLSKFSFPDGAPFTMKTPWKRLRLHRSFDTITIPNAVDRFVSVASSSRIVEVTQETIWPVVEAAGERLVVLDFYTQRCGACTLIYPKLLEMSEKYPNVLFLKVDCTQENKALAKKFGVKAVPSFVLIRHRQAIGEVRGPKLNDLVESIEKAGVYQD